LQHDWIDAINPVYFSMNFFAWIARRGPQIFVAAGLFACISWLLNATFVFWPSWISGNGFVLAFVYGPGPDILAYLGLGASLAVTVTFSAWIYGAAKLLRRRNVNFSPTPWVACLSIYAPVLRYIMPTFALSQLALHTHRADEQPSKTLYRLGATTGALFSLRILLTSATEPGLEASLPASISLAIEFAAFVTQFAFFVTAILFMRRMQRLQLVMLAEGPVA
jgi:hypothetical protein